MSKVSLPIAMGNRMKNIPGRLNQGGQPGTIRVCHREFICDVTSSLVNMEFDVNYRELNPGLLGSFPWLSKVATAFEMYKVISFNVLYKPSVGSSTEGAVCLAIDYDVSDYPPSNKLEMMAMQGATKCPVWTESRLAVETGNRNRAVKERYLRSGMVEGVDLKLYDFGCLYFATANMEAKKMVGELYFEYEIELMIPQIDNSVVTPDYAIVQTNDPSFQHVLLNADVIQDAYEPLVNLVPGGDSIQFNKTGKFLVELHQTGTGFSEAHAPRIANVTAEGNQTLKIGAVSAATKAIWSYLFDVEKEGSISFGIQDSATGLTSLGIKVAPFVSY